MKKIDRVKAALRGDDVDRPPYAFWTHLPGIDLDPEALAGATAEFAARHDLDFIKSMPNGLYCVEDWGAATDYSEIARGGVAKVTRPAVGSANDWRTLARVDVTRGAYGRELSHLAQLARRAGPDVPVLATVFSPLTVAAKLSNGAHLAHLETDPGALAQGLAVITEVTAAFAQAAIRAGCAGVFFAVQDASPSKLSEAVYRAHGEPFDRRVLRSAKDAGGWLNVLHMHGDDVMFDLLADYEVAALNWHIGETPPSIAAYRAAGGTRPIVGGLQRAAITRGDIAGVRTDIERTLRESGGRGILIAPACVIRHPVDSAILDHATGLIKGCAADATLGPRPPPA